ncbi:hypothetical protein DC522_01335 [Microvirga sp. KLBC 81]|uniref:AAA family ATPase n=1 Tax=Microvirga sp. KLBC 81 TaxID=1862707 RepID=UPI000D5139B7|nr:AAA family ATPase [Microvirga sp. KLBC 81]PVE26434.1 hypothetical protein DC522_01335 [Microvirga sp. KLBC 81]
MNAHAPIQADEATVRAFLTTLHAHAASAFEGASDPGYLQLVVVHPAVEGATPTRFAIGDIDGMVRACLDYAASGHNVYVEARTVPKATKGRGLTADTRGVFAFVIDSDNDKDQAGHVNAQPSLIVETSPGNRHLWFFLDQALTAEMAKPIGDAIRAAAGADHDTGTLTQPYRVAGTPNFPNAKKRKRGRVMTPTMLLQQDGTIWTPEALLGAFPVRPKQQRATPASRPHDGKGLLTVEPLVAERGENRSGQFQSAVNAAVRVGMTPDELEALMRRHPNGCASKYLEGRDRLRVEIERSWGKAPDGQVTQEAEPPAPIVAAPFQWCDPQRIPMRQWIYGRHYIRKFVSTTVSPGGVGKSSLGVVEALAIATGRPLLGVQPDEQTNVWVWNGEDPLEEMQRRIVAAAIHFGIGPQDLQGRLFVNSGRDTDIAIAEQTKSGTVICGPVVEQVIETIRANKIGLVIIDPFVSSHRVTENDNNAIDRVAKTWAKIADVTGCAIELVHHARKTGGNEVSVEDGRGAVALLAAARAARVLNPMSEDEAAKAGVENRRLHFRVDNGKANLSPVDQAHWFKLASVPLGNGPLGSEGDNIGVVTSWAWPDPFADMTVGDLRKVQQAVSQGRWRESILARDWVGKAVAEVLDLDPQNKAHRSKISNLVKTWIKNGALRLVDEKDERREIRTYVVVGEWAND